MHKCKCHSSGSQINSEHLSISTITLMRINFLPFSNTYYIERKAGQTAPYFLCFISHRCLVHILWPGVHITWKNVIKLNRKLFCLHLHSVTRSFTEIICIWRKCWDSPGTWCTPDAPAPCSSPSARPQTCCPRRGPPGSPSDDRTGPEGSEVTGVRLYDRPVESVKHSHLWTCMDYGSFLLSLFCALNNDTCSREFVLVWHHGLSFWSGLPKILVKALEYLTMFKGMDQLSKTRTNSQLVIILCAMFVAVNESHF